MPEETKQNKANQSSTSPLSFEEWQPTPGHLSSHSVALEDETMTYDAVADWVVLREDEKPVAAMFHTAYFRTDCSGEDRPITFLFNGGPGASSVYLHLGTVGPKRVDFSSTGEVLPPPHKLVSNAETWLSFTDLVFIDPIGTGFSRKLVPPKGGDKEGETKKTGEDAFWEVKRDLDSIGECITRLLSRHKRWSSPVFLAGESYGGFRVAALAKLLQYDFGVGLNGAVLVSPAIELSSLIASDYNVLPYCDVFPSLAACAHHHKKCATELAALSMDELLARAEAFAEKELLSLLICGDGMPEVEREALYKTIHEFVGLPVELVRSCKGRVTFELFCRRLLQDEGRVLAFHDGALSSLDPFRGRPNQEGPDAALDMTSRVFATGANILFHESFDLQTEQQYSPLNMKANSSWKDTKRPHFVLNATGAMDDLRYGMALNPAMEVMIVHGIHDLVTPYYASRRLLRHMQLPEELQERISLINYDGGHMYYAWEASRVAFTRDVAAFFAKATAHL
jgi:carboxypeptidase C (cathepsin A)